MSPVAEKAVLKLLENPNVGIRVEGCHILKEVGAKASVPALETATKDSNAGYASAAAEALKAIAERKKGTPGERAAALSL